MQLKCQYTVLEVKCAWYLHCIPSPKLTVLPVTTLKNSFSLLSVIFPELSITRTSDNPNFFRGLPFEVSGINHIY